MHFAALASGSKGNAWVVRHRDTVCLIDCGLNTKIINERLSSLALTPHQISAVFITHEHSDHCSGLASFHKHHPHTPIYTSHGTACAIGLARYHALLDQERVLINRDIEVLPFTVPHDAREPLQFRFLGQTEKGARHAAIVTDLGHPHPRLLASLEGLHALALEFNHEEDLLHQGDYPPILKKRIGGHYGHLGNGQSRTLLQTLMSDNLHTIVAAHLSENNNRADLVREHINHVWSDFTPNRQEIMVHIAEQNWASPWFEV